MRTAHGFLLGFCSMALGCFLLPFSSGTVLATGPAPSGTTSLTASPNPALATDSVTLTANVLNSSLVGVGGVTVTFYYGSTALGTGTTATGGSASITVAAGTFSAGAYTLSAVTKSYGTGYTVLNVCSGGTTKDSVTLSISPNPATTANAITMTATLSKATATGTVSFEGGGGANSLLGSASVVAGVATLTLAAGTLQGGGLVYSITAFYTGDSTYACSTSSTVTETVNSPGSTSSTVSLAASPSPATTSQSITLTATVTPSTATGTVDFYDGTTFLGAGTVSSGVATLSIGTYAAGTYSFSATYGGDSTYASSTGTVSETVSTTGGSPAPSTTTLTTSANPADVVTFTAVVSGGSSSTITPTGSITFNNTSSSVVLCSAVPIAEGTLPVYEAEATCSVTLPTAGGPFSIDAVYSGDTNYSTSTSNTLSQATNTCAGGALSLSAPASISMPGPTLTGLDQSVASSVTLDPSDMTGTGSGWNVQATSTTFADAGGAVLPTAATSFSGASVAAGSGNCNLPTNSVTYSVVLPAAATAPTAAVIYSAANSTGEGPCVITMAFSTVIPADAYAQSYSSIWTFTIVSGP